MTTTTTTRTWRETLLIQVISLVILAASALGFGCAGTLTGLIPSNEPAPRPEVVVIAALEGPSCGLEAPVAPARPPTRFGAARCTQ